MHFGAVSSRLILRNFLAFVVYIQAFLVYTRSTYYVVGTHYILNFTSYFELNTASVSLQCLTFDPSVPLSLSLSLSLLQLYVLVRLGRAR